LGITTRRAIYPKGRPTRRHCWTCKRRWTLRRPIRTLRKRIRLLRSARQDIPIQMAQPTLSSNRLNPPSNRHSYTT